MNGIEWPSPAATLQSVESEIKTILAAVGVDIPNCSSGSFLAFFSIVHFLFVTVSSMLITTETKHILTF